MVIKVISTPQAFGTKSIRNQHLGGGVNPNNPPPDNVSYIWPSLLRIARGPFCFF